MSGLQYLFLTSIKNRVRQALKKPFTYLYLVLGVCYVMMIYSSCSNIIENIGIGTPSGFAVIVSLGVFTFLPANMLTYARRKGLLFRPSEVHFVFPGPVNPKLVLLYAGIKTILISLLINLVLVILGILYFQVTLGTMLLFFVLAFIVENIIECSIMILIYGNEKWSKKQIQIFSGFMIAIIGALVLFAAALYIKEKASLQIVAIFLAHPFVQCVPVIGWNIAFIRLLLLGPTVLNVVCTILYVMTAVVFGSFAFRMTCTGEYYEDAMKFADFYAERIKLKKKGVMELSGKKKFRHAVVTYKGKYAKAIFYRQLLEYKKNRFFIFGLFTVVNVIAGLAIAVFAYYNYEGVKEFKVFLIPGVIGYVTFIFSTTLPKWMKELENPYTFMIPDTAIKKLWYSTLLEHLRAFADGCLITVPGAIMLRLSLVQTLLIILFYVFIMAGKLYINLVCVAFLGKLLGAVGKQLFKLFVHSIVITVGIGSAVVGFIFGGVELAFLLMIAALACITLILAIIGAQSFERMESYE